jgi:hypothetical protein
MTRSFSTVQGRSRTTKPRPARQSGPLSGKAQTSRRRLAMTRQAVGEISMPIPRADFQEDDGWFSSHPIVTIFRCFSAGRGVKTSSIRGGRNPFMKIRLQYFCILLALFAGVHQSAAQGTTAFTYQGQLHDSGTNANGTYTMIFKLYDAVSSGTQIGSTFTTSPTLANGLFSVNLDFGAGVFNGSARWLDITVTNGGASQELSPRVQVLPTPYAQFAAVAATVTNGAIMNAQLAGSAVADANIVSVNGSKVFGTVASATNAATLTNGNWNVSVGTFNGYVNSFTINNNNSLVMGMNTSGDVVLVPNNGNYTVGIIPGELGIHGDIDMNDGPIINVSELDANTVNAMAFNNTSDRNLKEKFTPVSSSEILERVANLPISSWNFKTDGQIRHIGPMAQDFYTAFKVGTDDRHIATVDEGGVALAAIQGLNEKLKEKDAQIEALNKRLADLEQLVKSSVQK